MINIKWLLIKNAAQPSLKTILKTTVLSCVLFSCSSYSQQISRSQINSSFDIQYGTIENVATEKIQSNAPKGAVIGGLLGGLTSNHSHRGKHALEGAAAGALLGALFQGNRKAFSYTIALNNGDRTRVITEQAGMVVGDCVAVEKGQTANVRRVSSVHCEVQTHEAYSEPVVYSHRQSEAAECHTAKEMALKATTDDEIELALKKVRIFCEG